MQDPKVRVTSNSIPPINGTREEIPYSNGHSDPNFEQELVQELKAQTFPTNLVQLPSKGLLYSEDDPLSKGSVEMKFMTTKEENILTTESYIKAGVVIDKFLQSMVISPKFNYDNLLIGDKDQLILASRIYGYGEIYAFEVTTPSGKKQKVEINLEEIECKEVDETLFNRDNLFNYSFENRKGKFDIQFKLLTVGDNKKIDEKLKRKKAGTEDTQVTTRLEQMIVSVNGNSDPNLIRLFIANDFLVRDSRAFRDYVAKMQPGPNMEVEIIDEETGDSFLASLTIGPNFFWPDINV